MSGQPQIDQRLRDLILKDPEVVLEDADLMRALVAANEQSMGGNIVDLRGIAMARLETRLDRLEDTHRNVIAAAYDNLAGTNQIHRAVLRMMEATKFEVFLRDLETDVADILRVESLRLVLETSANGSDPAVQRLGDVLAVVRPGFVQDYLTQGRNIPQRQIILRQVQPNDDSPHGEKSEYIRSEACLRLDFGQNRLPGMLLLGSEDPHQFSPQQGTDLLSFFAGVFERAMRRWLD
jgi:uncharacterized protein YigA (DUF484 family)